MQFKFTIKMLETQIVKFTICMSPGLCQAVWWVSQWSHVLYHTVWKSFQGLEFAHENTLLHIYIMFQINSRNRKGEAFYHAFT